MMITKSCEFQFAKLQVEGLKSQSPRLLSLQHALFKAQISQGLGLCLQLELSRTGRTQSAGAHLTGGAAGGPSPRSAAAAARVRGLG